MRLVVLNHLSLDGVMQSPARPDEDSRGGFTKGGWAVANSNDEVVARTFGAGINPGGGMLLGRRSYEEMLRTWNERGGPFKEAFNRSSKFVVSHDASTKLAWPNSTLLTGDVPVAVRELKKRSAGDLLIMGSGALIRSLLPYRLIDEFILVIHPLILGSGQRMFPDPGETVPLRLVDSVITSKGVIIATYRSVSRDAHPALTAADGQVEAP